MAGYRQAALTEEEARRRSVLAFGGIEQIQEECRDARGTRWIESTVQDLRLSLAASFFLLAVALAVSFVPA